MRVLYSFPHPLGRPGIGSTAFHEVEGILRRGVEVLLYCTSLERDVRDATVVQTLTVSGVRIPHRLLGVERSYRYHDGRVARALRRHAGEIDVVHAWPHAAERTFAEARSLGIPCVREAPNTHTAYAFEAVARETEALGLEPVKRHSHTFDDKLLDLEEREYASADIVLVPSEFARRTFLDHGIPAEKLALHQYGFDPQRFYSDEAAHDAARRERGLTALFVGSCEPRKGLHYALQAWVESGAAADGRFIICGSFVPGYREAIAHWLNHPSVEVRGFVADPGPLMRESDIFVLPSLEEGSAIVTYEAQASGCVLVVSDAAGARVDHMRRGLVHQAGDVETLTQHLRMLNESRETLTAFRQAAIAARNALTWDCSAQELTEIYERLVGGAPHPGKTTPLASCDTNGANGTSITWRLQS